MHGLLAATTFESNLLAARWQMAFTLGMHIILASLGVGLPILLLAAEWAWLRTKNPVWLSLTKRWAKAFAVLFAVGAVSGTVLSFEMGLLWPDFSGRFGAVIGLPFSLEAFAFFLEAVFIGIYLYGWDRLSPRAHWWSGVPIALSGAASACFVVSANAWMNTPRGFTLGEDGRLVDVNPLVAMLNPSTAPQAVHMLLAAYAVTGFLVAGYYAARLLRVGPRAYETRAMALGLVLGGIAALLQAPAGDWAAQVVAKYQPVKFAAMEGQFETAAYAPLRIGGWPDEEAKTTRGAIEIPGMLSWLAHRDRAAVVAGLNDVPADRRPPSAVVHVAFQLMVGIGTFLILLAVGSALWAWRYRRLPHSRWYLGTVVAAGPLSVLALEAGWVVTEVGRQPWIVQGYMRTREAVTTAPGVWPLFGITLAVYAVLAAGTVLVLRLLAAQELGDHSKSEVSRGHS